MSDDDGEMTTFPEELAPPYEGYEGKMKSGHFEVLCHGGTNSNPMVLEFVDIHPDLQDFIEDEMSASGPFLDDLGWIEELEGLAVIIMRYTTTTFYNLDGPEDEFECVEVSRTSATWKRHD